MCLVSLKISMYLAYSVGKTEVTGIFSKVAVNSVLDYMPLNECVLND